MAEWSKAPDSSDSLPRVRGLWAFWYSYGCVGMNLDAEVDGLHVDGTNSKDASKKYKYDEASIWTEDLAKATTATGYWPDKHPRFC
ncbi:unnamed protein product [Caenorhabditis auriculariae]|uniref:Uncharacterized protein n=1 Tax=Caenorhabditis auriculariae TaxID=2777116 RepID=A0A8S1GUJ1_9PELO|nr:unnamed protein product [Caenorhabditis auriculariae]